VVRQMKINGKRLLDNLYALREFTDTPGKGVTRFSYGEQDVNARRYILDIAERLGCSISIDALQNIRLGFKGNVPGRKTIAAGSHIDTVRNGGWLDGIYGVCGALEVMETLTENLADYDYNYEVVIFAEEEGSGFGSTMTGSKFISGIYDESDLDKLKNDEGKTLREVLAPLQTRCCCDVRENPYRQVQPKEAGVSTQCGESSVDISRVMWDFDTVKTMLELHIEQGPVLDEAGLSIGIVDNIFGMRVIEVKLDGVGNHAGATPMSQRHDALCTAAECILKAEEIVRADEDKRTVVTTGKIEAAPNCSNVIPETVTFTLEVRDRDEAKINKAMDEITGSIRDIADRRRVSCTIEEHSKSSPLPLNRRLIDSMAARAEGQGLPYKVMDSGAVHDACMIAAHVDTGMIFVPSIEGRSHVPQENTAEEHLLTGAQFLMDTVLSELASGK